MPNRINSRNWFASLFPGKGGKRKASELEIKMSEGWGRRNFFHRRRGRNRQIKEGLRGRKRGEAGGRLLRFTAAPRCCAAARTDDARVGVKGDGGGDGRRADGGAPRSTNSAQVSLAFRPSVRSFGTHYSIASQQERAMFCREKGAREKRSLATKYIWAAEKGLVFTASNLPTMKTTLP